MNKRNCVLIAAAIALGLVRATPAWSQSGLNMPQGVTTVSHDIYDLHMLIMSVCAVIGVLVYAAMVVAIVRFRKSAGAKPAKFTHNSLVEVIWTVIPAAILIGLAIPSAETLVSIEDTRDSDMTIKITGYQWQWHYDYLDYGVSFFSRLDRESDAARQIGSGIDPQSVENYLLEVDNHLVVPVDAKVRLLVTGADVLHSWWMPQFGVKKDAIPGFINEAWFQADTIGTYRGQCAELCGMGHGFMPIVVDVVSAEDFEAWLSERGATVEETDQ